MKDIAQEEIEEGEDERAVMLALVPRNYLLNNFSVFY